MKRFWFSVGLALSTAGSALAVPSTLNYQGQLLVNGTPATGPVTIIFRMFDAATGGTELWTETDNVTVTSGLFQTTLGDGTALPATLFTAQVPWLEMEVNGTVLAPRTQFQSVPYALNVPSTGVTELWSTDGTNVWRGSGNVGIGMATPNHPFEVHSTIPGQTAYFHSTSTSGTNYGVDAGAQGAGATTNIGGYFYASGATNNYAVIVPPGYGDVGIGTSVPDRKLTVVVPTGVNDIARFRTDNGNCDVVISAADNQVASIRTLAGQGLAIGTNDGNGPIRITSNGDVGIGTSTPEVKLHVIGSFTATGAKCREVSDPKHGKIYYNAVESANALFSLEGEATLKDGHCSVQLDPKWLAGVTIDRTQSRPERVRIARQ